MIDLLRFLAIGSAAASIFILYGENRILKARIAILEDCAKEMAGIYKELARVINCNGQATEKLLRHTLIAVTQLTNRVSEQDIEEN